jgi:hypothetical protein
MIFELLVHNPWPWMFAAGVCAGGALSSLTRRASRARDPEKARERKVFAAAVAITLGVIFGLCAVFIPGPDKIRDPGLLVFTGIVTGVSFLAFRFRKAAGLPVVLLAGGLVIALVLFFQAVTAFTGETEIARLSVKEADGTHLKFELVDRAGQATPIDMPGTLLGAEMKEIIFHDVFVFFGAKTAYRFLGLKSATVRPGSEMTQELRAWELPRPEGVSEALYRFVEANQHALPFVKTVQTQITYVTVKPGAVYAIRVQHDSGTEIMKVNLRAE